MVNRIEQLQNWLREHLAHEIEAFEAVSGDASFRRYFRFNQQEETWIAVDAPPEKESLQEFVTIAQTLKKMNVHVPEVGQVDYSLGFAILSDLGDTLMANIINDGNFERYYQKALFTLLNIYQQQHTWSLPDYNTQLLEREIDLFIDWFLIKHLGLTLSQPEQQILEATKTLLVTRALAQPQVFVHRDYHSRNLMWHQERVGVIDFQDAVIGPYTYDLVSLLKDCYLRWQPDTVRAIALNFRSQLGAILPQVPSESVFLWDFDWMGLQRHLKAIGIFARLQHRDNKPMYLDDIPRVLGYVIEIAETYGALSDFHAFLQKRVIPSVPINREIGNPQYKATNS
ncbi:MAG: phosphotransferase [Pseudomonadota bacterium]